MKTQEQTISRALSCLLGISVFLFFAVRYPYHLHYQEQFQLFLFTSGYLNESTGKPGGFANYIGGFLTQFYYLSWLGAGIIAALLVTLQRFILAAAYRIGQKPAFIPLTFIPSLYAWVLLCDESYMLAGFVSLVLVLAAFLFYTSISFVPLRMVYTCLMLPFLYGLLGGPILIFGVLCIAWECARKELSAKQLMLYSIVCLLLIVLPPLGAKNYGFQYPLGQLWLGVRFFRYAASVPAAVYLLGGLTALLPVLFRFLPAEVKPRRMYMGLGIQVIALAFATFYGVRNASDFKKEETMAYDYHLRMRQWDEIIHQADKQAPASPLSVASLNLVLCKTGRMPDRMFHYFQNGPEGLFPSFIRDFTAPLISGEIYYHLGFVNTAQRFAFEAMEAQPDYQKNVRVVKRLAETNLINGEYAVAAKYLRMLQHTLFYKEWATQTLDCLGDEQKMEAHPEWSTLRRFRTQKDFLFSEREADMMLGILLQQNPANRMAYEYLMAYCLLTKDLQHFLSYYPMGKEIGYERIPVSYQEALIYIWGLTNNDPSKDIPYPVSDEIKQQVQAYGAIYTSYQNAEPMLQKQYSGTYWYYLHFKK